MDTDLYRRPRHPIRVVMDRTGLPLETLRAWERRYGAVRPERTEGAQRRYSDADVERLRALARVVAGGRSIGQVARLSTEELAALAREDAESSAPGAEREDEARRWRPLLEAAQEAVSALDAGRLDAVLRKAAALAGAAGFIGAVAIPLLRWLGSGWSEGTLTVAHEHLASVVLRRVLGSLLAEAEAAEGSPVLVCATPAGQAHEFGVLIAAVIASAAGWRVVYLGADLPATDIAAAVEAAGARAVALSVVYPADDPRLPDELRRLRAAIGPRVRILVGGSGIGQLRGSLDGVQVELVGELAELETTLGEDGRRADQG